MAKDKTRFPVPDLPGWESLPFAAKRLGVKRQRLFQMGAEEGKLKTLHKLPGAGDRPAAYVVATAEIDALLEVQRTAIAGHSEECPAMAVKQGAPPDVVVNVSPDKFCAVHRPALASAGVTATQ